MLLEKIKSKFKDDFRFYYIRNRVDLDKCVRYYFIDNDVAYVTCKVSGIDDVISHYCVKGYEILSEEFTDHLDRIMTYIPVKYPLVLEITGCKFTDEEKKTIEDTIWTQYELRAGMAQKAHRGNIARIIWFAVSLLLSALLLREIELIPETILQELGFVLFWFFGDRLVEYVLLDESDISRQGMHTAQLQSMKVIFTEHYSDENLSAEEVEQIRTEVIENVMNDEV